MPIKKDHSPFRPNKSKPSPTKKIKRNLFSFFGAYKNKKDEPLLVSASIELPLGGLLTITAAFLYGFGHPLPGLICLIFGGAGLLVGGIALVYAYGRKRAQDEEATNSLLSQMDAFDGGQTRIVEPSWNEEKSDALQRRLNAFLQRTDRLLEGEAQTPSSKAPTFEVLSEESFLSLLPSQVESNPSPLSCLLLFRLASKSAPRKEALSALKSALRQAFPADLMGEMGEDQVGVYVYYASSKSALRGRLETFVSEFAFCLTDPQTSKMAVYGVGVSGAYYPGVEEASLLHAAKRALSRGSGIELEEGPAPIPSKPVNPHLPPIARKAEVLAEQEKLGRELMDRQEPALRREAFLSLLHFNRTLTGFESAGVYVFDPRKQSYALFAHDEEGEFLGLARLGERLASGVLDPFYQIGELEAPFYVPDALSLPHDVSLSAQSIGIGAMILYSIRHGGEKAGFVYFCSKESRNLSLEIRAELAPFFPRVSSYLLYANGQENESLRTGILNSLCAKKGLYCYSIDRESRRLIGYSDNLPKKFKGAQIGEVCHRALYHLDEPCPNCPLNFGPSSRVVVPLGSKEFTQSVLYYRQGQQGEATLMLERTEEKSTGASLLDKALQIKNAKAFQIEANRSLRNPLSRGYFLAIRLINKPELLDRLPDQNSNSLLGAASREITSLGHDESLFRFDPDTLVLHFPTNPTRSALFIAIEDIAAQIHGPLFAGSDAFTPFFAYSLIHYPTDVNNVNDLTSLLQTELVRCQKLGVGLVSEVGKAKARKAHRGEYVQSLLEEKLQNGRVDLIYLPLAEVATQEIRIAQVKADLVTEDHAHVHYEEFRRIGDELGWMPRLDYAVLGKALDFYSANRDTLFHDNGIQGLFCEMDESTFLDRNFLLTVSEKASSYDLPKNYLALTFPASFLFKNPELTRSRSRDLHQGHILLVAREFTPGEITPQRLAELGVDVVELSASFLAEALESESERMAYTSCINDLNGSGVIPIAMGAKTEDAYRFIQGLGIPYLAGPFVGNSGTEGEFASLLSYRR